MSYFGRWECPVCKSTWTGSIGWKFPETQELLDKMLHNLCGCDGAIEGAPMPELSFSVGNFESSDERNRKLAKV